MGGMRYSGEHLFVYGTLLLPQIMQRVCGQTFFQQRAQLSDYARYALRGKHYPGIIAETGSRVVGQVFFDLSPRAWQRLDAYEGYEYLRQRVQIEIAVGEKLGAWSYIIPPDRQSLLGRHDWSLLQFQQRHLQGYLERL